MTIIGLLLTYRHDNKHNSVNNLYFLTLSSVIVLTVCLHGENIGPDTHTYMYLSMHPEYIGFSKSECILPILHSILRYIWPNPYFINFVVLLLYQIPIFVLINKYSTNRYFSILLYISFSVGLSIFILSMVALRQSLAVGFIALAIIAYCDNLQKINIKVVLCLILSVLSHTSSILFLPVFFIANYNFSKKQYLFICVLACLIGISIDKVIAPILSFLTTYDKGFYMSGDFQESSFLTVVPFVSIFFAYLYVFPRECLQSIWFKGLFMAIVVTCMIYGVANNLERICMYYYLLSLIAIPQTNFIGTKMSKNIHRLTQLVIIAYFSRKYFVVLDILSTIDYPFVPYNTFLK